LIGCGWPRQLAPVFFVVVHWLVFNHHIGTLSISVQCWHKEPFAPARGPNIGRELAVTARQKCFYMAPVSPRKSRLTLPFTLSNDLRPEPYHIETHRCCYVTGRVINPLTDVFLYGELIVDRTRTCMRRLFPRAP
jgi:hypothetical protein